MLMPEDSKRVADAMIQKIEETNIDSAIGIAVREWLRGEEGKNKFVADWFPLTVQQMCERMAESFDHNVEIHLRDRSSL